MSEPTVIHVESLAAIGSGEPTLTSGTITGNMPRDGISFKTERRIANMPVEIHIDEATQRKIENHLLSSAIQTLQRREYAQMTAHPPARQIVPWVPPWSEPPWAPSPPITSDRTDQALASFLASDSTAFRLLRDPAALNALWDAANVPHPPRYVGPRRAARRRHHRRLKRR